MAEKSPTPKAYTDKSKIAKAAAAHATNTIKGENPVRAHLAAKKKALEDGRTVSGKVIKVEGDGGPSVLQALAGLWPFRKKSKSVETPAAAAATPPAIRGESLDYKGPAFQEKTWQPLTRDLIALCNFKITGNRVDPDPETGHKPGEIGDAVLLVRIARAANEDQIEDIEHSLGEFGAGRVAVKDAKGRFGETGFEIVGDHHVVGLLRKYEIRNCPTEPAFQRSTGFDLLMKAGRDGPASRRSPNNL